MEFLNLFNTVFLYSADPASGGGDPDPKPADDPNPAPDPVPTPPATDPKLYNQDQLNGIVGSRIAEERQKIYSQFGVEGNQELQSIFDNAKILEKENATLKAQIAEFEATQLKEANQQKLLKAGIEPDLVDIALAKWDGNEETLEAFLEENPKLTTAYFEGKFFMGTGASLEQRGGRQKPLDQMDMDEFMEYHRKKEQT